MEDLVESGIKRNVLELTLSVNVGIVDGFIKSKVSLDSFTLVVRVEVLVGFGELN